MRQTLLPFNVTRSTNLRGAQRAPELTLRSTEFRSPENLNFSSPHSWSFTCYFSWIHGSSSKCGQFKSSIGITLVDVLQNWLSRFQFLFLEGGLLFILIDCMIFLSLFLDVPRISMSTVCFLAKLDPGILCLSNAFRWPMILVALSLELTDIF